MTPESLFTAALALEEGWKVERCEFAGDPKRLMLGLDFDRGRKFGCPQCGELCGVHDSTEKEWRHLDFFQYECLLQAKVPRVGCPEHGVLQVKVPWARSGSGFTLLFEALTMLLAREMPMSAVAETLDERDTRLWRVARHYVEAAHARESWSEVTRICVDETSARRGHRYVTNIIDADTHQLLLMVEGRSAQALAAFARELIAHGGAPQQIVLISMDMSEAYQKGARESFPWADIVFDRFHLMMMAGVACDQVRKMIARQGADLTGALWALRGNEWSRSDAQQAMRRNLTQLYPKLGRALGLRESLQDILAGEDEDALRWWCKSAKLSRLEPFHKLACSIQRHWSGIVAFLKTRVTNGAIEAINGLLQLAKRLARGYRSIRNFQVIAYLKAGKLHLQIPALRPTLSTHSI